MPPRKKAAAAVVKIDSDGDSDIVELIAAPVPPATPSATATATASPVSASASSRPRRAAAEAGDRKRASISYKESDLTDNDDDDDEIAIVSVKKGKGKGKGKAKATSDDEREHALERATSRHQAQIDADALLAAQLATANGRRRGAADDEDGEDGSDDDFDVQEDHSEDEEDDSDSDSDFSDEELPLSKRKRVVASKGKGKGKKSNAATPVRTPNDVANDALLSKMLQEKEDAKALRRAMLGDDYSTDDDDDDSLSELYQVRLHNGHPIAHSVPKDFVFKKPDNSNYIKTPENLGKRLPIIIKELANEARMQRMQERLRREAEEAETAKTVAGAGKKKTTRRSAAAAAAAASSSSAANDGAASSSTAAKGKAAKGSMQEEQRYETAIQREHRLRTEARLARSAAIDARTGRKRTRLSHYEKNKVKLQQEHPELTSIWHDLADIPIPEPQKADPPTNLSKGVTLLPFQLESLHWLVKQEDSPWQGGLLADEMGMGKTVQMISLMLTDEKRRKAIDKARATLVVAPTVAIMQWSNELAKYAPQFKVVLWHGANRAAVDSDEMRKADVVLTSYAVLESSFRRQETGFVRKGEKFTEKSAVHTMEWRRVVLDEAHNIKDRATNTARGAFALRAMYRWCLSGTPLQNRVGELFSMVRFIGAEPFANYYCLQCDCKSLHWNMVKGKFCAVCGHTPMQHTCFWNNEVLKPIQRNGAEAGEGKDAFMRLRTLLQHMMLRRTKLERADDMGLPPRTIVVRRDVFNEEEADLYQSLYTDGQRKFTTFIDSGTVLNNYSNIFTLLTRMRQMACHPDLVLRSKTGTAAKLLGDDVNETHVCKLCADEAEDPIMSACRHVFCRGCIGEYVGDGEDSGQKLECPYCHANLAIDLEQETMDAPRPEQNARQGLLSRLDLSKWRSSTKIEALVEELSALRSEDHTIKSIVFSQFRSFLDLIALRLSRAGFKIARLEGDMTPQQRDRTIKFFSENTSVTVFLISLKAGGVALNLTEASRVYLMDPWWNPSVEMQAADRIHRIGQHRPIIVKRMIIENSIEARIVELQNKKSAMIEAAIGKDDSAMGRLSVADLQFLFTL
ncbi:DNA repair protein rad16 [Tilletia horrida]|uniref:DNA repair protein rad16 n=1 Tax=Tilletia horrida TaxID=155126 RepID=A0AAN6JNV9_9BASI|nr:DNA repair protein rad16 [Tilletia horrida]KAK0524183.1 DNA repair protein rad16 [Tilletia horrida]